MQTRPGWRQDEINANGGLLDRTVELVTQTNIEEASAAVHAAQQMIQDDGVFAILGPNRSSHAVQVGPVAHRAQIPMITTSATNPNVTRAGDYVFMAAFTDQFQGAVLARFAWEDLGKSVAAVLTLEGDLYTEGISMFFVSHFTELGGTVIANEVYSAGDTTFTEQLGRISEAEPDVFFVSGLVAELAHVVRETRTAPVLNAQGAPVTLLGADAWDNPLFLDAGTGRGRRELLQRTLFRGVNGTRREGLCRGVRGRIPANPQRWGCGQL